MLGEGISPGVLVVGALSARRLLWSCRWEPTVAADIGLDQSGVHVHIPRQHTQAQRFTVKTVKDCGEVFRPDTVDEIAKLLGC